MVVYRSLDEFTDEFKLTLIESGNVDVLKTVYGKNNVDVDESGDITIDVKSESPQELVWVFEFEVLSKRANSALSNSGSLAV